MFDAPETFRHCWAEVDPAALRHNVGIIRRLAGPDASILAVVKANAYGHGMREVAEAIRERVTLFGVANAMEAAALQPVAAERGIVILGPALPAEREIIVRHSFLPLLSSLDEARAYAALIPAQHPPFEVHLKIDTGMGRMGVWHEAALETARAIAALPGLRLTGAATHLPSADEDCEWTRGQLALWNDIAAALRAEFPQPLAMHSLNSAGIIRFHREAGGDTLIRPGLMLYGCSPVPEFGDLQPALTWKSRVSLLRSVPEGRGVSYGRTFVTPAPMRIATVCAGYADGYPRRLSNAGAEVLIRGQRCPLLGRVTMDQMLVDVSALPEATEGDEVVLMGRQGQEEIAVAELARRAGTIPWEIFTGISPRVVRYYI